MKPISADTRNALYGLNAGASFWSKPAGNDKPPESGFEIIVDRNEALAIPHFVGFVLHDRTDVREAAAEAIGVLINRLSSIEFAQLDEACRGSFWSGAASSLLWTRLGEANLQSFWQLPQPVAVLGLASFHRSGFLRFAAIKQLSKSTEGLELPFLLVRLNDWVEPVRQAAVGAILARLRDDYIRHFVSHLPLIQRLRTCGRAEHGPILQAVASLLKQPEAIRYLRSGFSSNDRSVRRECFQLAASTNTTEGQQLLEELLTNGADPILRLWAARKILRSIPKQELAPIIDNLRHDTFMPIRLEALTVSAEMFPDSIQSFESALADRHASVRTLARFWLGKAHKDFDFAVWYRQLLNSAIPAKQRIALLGLSEVGDPSDAKLIIRFLSSPLVGLRKAANRAIGILDGDRYESQLLAAIADENPGVSNEATHALKNKVGLIRDDLTGLFRAESQPHVRKNLFSLLLHQPFWQRGVFLLKTLSDNDQQIAEAAQFCFRKWFYQSSSMAAPSTTELEELKDAFNVARGKLSPKEQELMEFLIKSYTT